MKPLVHEWPNFVKVNPAAYFFSPQRRKTDKIEFSCMETILPFHKFGALFLFFNYELQIHHDQPLLFADLCRW